MILGNAGRGELTDDAFMITRVLGNALFNGLGSPRRHLPSDIEFIDETISSRISHVYRQCDIMSYQRTKRYLDIGSIDDY